MRRQDIRPGGLRAARLPARAEVGAAGISFDLDQAVACTPKHPCFAMKKTLFIIAAIAAASFGAAGEAGDADRGELLYGARCVGCHTESVHNRAARKALTIDGIKAQVRRWNAYLNGAWGEREINDVTTYLNDLYYKYPCTPDVCPDDKRALRRAAPLSRRVANASEPGG
jgi:mono/diheme cytochrome c family protein